jgi:ferredoxin
MMKNISMKMTFCFLIAVMILQTESFFLQSRSTRHIKSDLSMMFGKKAAGISIKVDGKTITSGEKSVNLRKELIANNVDVYPLKAKITGNCGGAGICGTCAVKVLEGGANMSPMSKNEQNTLKGKPDDFRLSCCARVTGPISIKLKP